MLSYPTALLARVRRNRSFEQISRPTHSASLAATELVNEGNLQSKGKKGAAVT